MISEARPEDAWSGRSGFVHRAVMEDLPDLSPTRSRLRRAGHGGLGARDFTSCALPEDEFYADSFTTQADLASDELR